MVHVKPIVADGKVYIGVHVALPKTNLIAISCETGYIMCGALDVRLLNEKLAERGIIAGRAVGVRTFEELLDAPLESTTTEASKIGIVPAITGRQALAKMANLIR